MIESGGYHSSHRSIPKCILDIKTIADGEISHGTGLQRVLLAVKNGRVIDVSGLLTKSRYRK